MAECAWVKDHVADVHFEDAAPFENRVGGERLNQGAAPLVLISTVQRDRRRDQRPVSVDAECALSSGGIIFDNGRAGDAEVWGLEGAVGECGGDGRHERLL